MDERHTVRGERARRLRLQEPGIDEEIRLARIADLPVYLLGAPGGQTARIAARAAGSTPPWSNLGNPLSAETNAWLRETDAYEQAARLIWAARWPAARA